MSLPQELYDIQTGERKYLNVRERAAFFEATLLQEAKVKYYCQMLFYTGCRTSEALQACPERFDYAEKGMIFRTLKQGKDKNGKPIIRHRFNELPDSYLHEIQGVYNIPKHRGKESGKERIWSFTDRTARTYVKDVMTRAGSTGRKATSRGLRHSMGVSLAMNGVPLNTIKNVLGHKSIKNTMIYFEIVEHERRSLVSKAWNV